MRTGVPSRFAVHDVDLRDGNAGGEGHFFDDVEELAFVRIRRVRINQPAIE
jgi:hypothetical protein